MSDLNIRLLLHRLWRMWRDSGRAKDRPPSFAFVPGGDQVRDAVLEQWGISVIASDQDDPQQGLQSFLDKLALDVRGGDGHGGGEGGP